MKPTSDRARAIELRKAGVSYMELMQRFGVAKSTLWRWLKAEGLVAATPQEFTELKRIAQRKGADLVRARRIERTRLIMAEARKDVGFVDERDLWLAGTVLYWAEGAKQNPRNVSSGVIFVNSDPAAVRLFMAWLKEICEVTDDRIGYEIYLHETANAERAQAYWAAELDLPVEKLSRIRWKRHRPATRRTNVGDTYHGLVRVRVVRSSALNRKIAGWIAGLSNSLGSGVMVTHLALDQKTPGSTPGSPADWVEPGQQHGDDPTKWLLSDVLGAYEGVAQTA